MTRLTAWIKTVVIGYGRYLTDEQISGRACALCGHRFFASEYRARFCWIAIPFLRRIYACENECQITAVTEVELLFRAAIPSRQQVRFWSLGVDDVPLVTDPHTGADMADEEYTARIDAQPKARVEILHTGGTLTTGPLPREHAGYIAAQARALGFTALVDAVDAAAGPRPSRPNSTP